MSFGRLGQLGLGRLGAGQGGAGAPSTANELSFLGGLPSGFTYAGETAGGARSSRGSGGLWAWQTANTARFHYDSLLAQVGCVLEKSYTARGLLRTNPSAPVQADWFTTLGAGGSTVSAVSSSLGLDAIGWQNAITSIHRVAAVGALAQHQINNVTGTSTDLYSYRVIQRDVGTSTMSNIQLTGVGAQIPVIQANTWEPGEAEGQTSSNTTRLMQANTRADHTHDIALINLTRSIYNPFPYFQPAGSNPTLANEYLEAALSSFSHWSGTEVAFAFEWYHEWPFTVDGEPLLTIYTDANNYCRIGGRADNTIRIDVVIGGAGVAQFNFAAPARRQVHRCAVRLQSGDFYASVDGVSATADTDAGDFSGLTTLRINRDWTTNYSNVIARSLEITDVPQSDAEIDAAATVGGGFV